jgi:hypothetical protein
MKTHQAVKTIRRCIDLENKVDLILLHDGPALLEKVRGGRKLKDLAADLNVSLQFLSDVRHYRKRMSMALFLKLAELAHPALATNKKGGCLMPDVYECDHCGACCKHLIIEIYHVDVVREPKLLPHAELLDGRGTIEFESNWEKEYLLACAKPCGLLGPDNLCTIYPTRPNCCVGLEAGDEQCQMAREAAGLEPLQPKGGAA